MGSADSDEAHWDARWRARDHEPAGLPCAWLRSVLDDRRCWPAIAGSAPVALDLACGHGRHALWLARRGFNVVGLDVSGVALDHVRRESQRIGLTLTLQRHDHVQEPLPEGPFDLIVVVQYLDRGLFSSLAECLRPGGLLVMETNTLGQRAFGPPHNRRFLLDPGELVRRVSEAGLEVLRAREGVHEEPAPCAVASVAARRPGPS
jgi:tellurite methyltransferase